LSNRRASADFQSLVTSCNNTTSTSAFSIASSVPSQSGLP
jgi:hypothetical protein